MIKPSLPTLPSFPTYLTYLTHLTYLTYLTYLTHLSNLIKTPDTVQETAGARAVTVPAPWAAALRRHSGKPSRYNNNLLPHPRYVKGTVKPECAW